ncbi:hypothetical protein RSAG8_10798, partial [Rhizoctonia solani AG-8 WAC10335]
MSGRQELHIYNAESFSLPDDIHEAQTGGFDLAELLAPMDQFNDGNTVPNVTNAPAVGISHTIRTPDTGGSEFREDFLTLGPAHGTNIAESIRTVSSLPRNISNALGLNTEGLGGHSQHEQSTLLKLSSRVNQVDPRSHLSSIKVKLGVRGNGKTTGKGAARVSRFVTCVECE